jgi:hypothetical protein
MKFYNDYFQQKLAHETTSRRQLRLQTLFETAMTYIWQTERTHLISAECSIYNLD